MSISTEDILHGTTVRNVQDYYADLITVASLGGSHGCHIEQRPTTKLGNALYGFASSFVRLAE